MKKIFGLIGVCLLALPVAAFSQGPPEDMIEFSPWWDKPVVRDLGLSQDQLEQIRTVVSESRDNLIKLRADVKIAEGHLVDAMNQETVDDSKTAKAIDEIVTARGGLMSATSQMSVRIRKILSYTQWQELRKRAANRMVNTLDRRQRARTGR